MTQRLANAKDLTSNPVGLHSHEDLAKKLKVLLIEHCDFCS